MRVLLAAKDLSGYGGVNNVAVELAKHMAPLGVEFYVLSYRTRGFSWMKEHLPLPKSSGLPIVDVFEAPLRARGAFGKAVDRAAPDLVHVHTPALVPPRGTPSLVTVHGTYMRDVPNLLKYPVSLPYKAFLSSLIYAQYRFERHALRYFDRFHAVSTMTAGELKAMGVPPGSISMVPNGVDTSEFRPRRPSEAIYDKYGLDPGSRTVLSVGTITPRKGAHLVVEAAKEVLRTYRDALFVFAGACPRLGRSYLKRMGSEASGRIRFIGPVPQEDLLGLYNACSTFVSASYTEGCSLNILEAAACGKQVVSTDVGGARDVLGDLGIYVPAGDPKALATGITKALDMGSSLSGQLRERMETRFSWESIAKDMLAVYRSAAEK
jgi:glycosyltransferase involved in cell wall biosynthesis